MRSRTWAVALLSASLFLPMRAAPAAALEESGENAESAESATLLRIFLRDGTSLVSYGEPARVGDRVVFSMPTAITPNPPLHPIDLPADRVDWDRTDRYANAARAAQYLKAQADLDYAELSNILARTLDDVATAASPGDRLAVVERARSMLVEWPQRHYNYRQAEVRQMVGMLDEAIADLRASAGASRFDLSLSAFAEPPPITEPLLPPLTLRESIEQVLNAARVVDRSAERVSLLSTALGAIERDKGELPSEFVATRRTEAQAALNLELQIDRSYAVLTSDMLKAADRRANQADVRGLERLLAGVRGRDAELGYRRPEAVGALIQSIEAKLDRTRRLLLARDRWELRLPALTAYGTAIRAPIALFAQLKPALEDIKALAGSSPASLVSLERRASLLLERLSKIGPPEELAAAHALMVSAAQLASNAVIVRREAILANDIDRAWNASSAAAGALMLGARARADIRSLLRPPRLQLQ